MPKIGFDPQSFSKAASDVERADVTGIEVPNARPSVVTLESGVKAIIEVAGFAYIKPLPTDGMGVSCEDVDTRPIVIGDPDGIGLKRVGCS